MAAAMTAALVMGTAVLPGEIARAEEAPFVDISTALISLSPQADEVTMSVAARTNFRRAASGGNGTCGLCGGWEYLQCGMGGA